MLKYLILISFLCSSALAGSSSASTSANSDKVLQLLEILGIHGELKDLSSMVSFSLRYYRDQNPGKIDDSNFAAIVTLAAKTYDGEKIYTAVQSTLATKFKDEELRELLEWYEDEPGYHLHTLETADGRVSGLRDLAGFLELSNGRSSQIPLSQLTHELDLAIFLSNDQLNTLMIIYRGIREGLNDLSPRSKRLSKAKLEKELFETRRIFRDLVTKAILQGIAKVFQHADPGELDAYSAFAREGAYPIFNREANKAVSHELSLAAINTKRGIAGLQAMSSVH